MDQVPESAQVQDRDQDEEVRQELGAEAPQEPTDQHQDQMKQDVSTPPTTPSRAMVLEMLGQGADVSPDEAMTFKFANKTVTTTPKKMMKTMASPKFNEMVLPGDLRRLEDIRVTIGSRSLTYKEKLDFLADSTPVMNIRS